MPRDNLLPGQIRAATVTHVYLRSVAKTAAPALLLQLGDGSHAAVPLDAQTIANLIKLLINAAGGLGAVSIGGVPLASAMRVWESGVAHLAAADPNEPQKVLVTGGTWKSNATTTVTKRDGQGRIDRTEHEEEGRFAE